MQLNNVDEIRELKRKYPLFGDLSLPPFIVKVADFSPQQNQLFQDRLNYYHSACGCGTGAVASIAGLIILWLSLEFGRGAVQLSLLRIILIGVAVFVVFGAIGKYIGIAHAHWQLKKLLNKMEIMLETSLAS